MTVIAYLRDDNYKYMVSDSRITIGDCTINIAQKVLRIEDLILSYCGSVCICEQIVACIKRLNKDNRLNDYNYLFDQFSNDYKSYFSERGLGEKDGGGSVLIMAKNVTLALSINGESDYYHSIITKNEFHGSGATETRAAFEALTPYIKDIKKRFKKALDIASSINSSIDNRMQCIRVRNETK